MSYPCVPFSEAASSPYEPPSCRSDGKPDALKKRSSSASGNDVNVSFFQRYGQLEEAINAAEGVDDRLKEATNAHENLEKKLENNEKKLDKFQRICKEQTDRIECVSTHWFYGTTIFQPQLWFRGGCQGKISRAQVKLERTQSKIPDVMFTIERVKTVDLPPLKRRIHDLTQQQSQRIQFLAERESMFESAVLANATTELVDLQREEAFYDKEALEINRHAQVLQKLRQDTNACASDYERAARSVRKAIDSGNRSPPTVAAGHPLLNPSFVSRQEENSVPAVMDEVPTTMMEGSMVGSDHHHCRRNHHHHHHRRRHHHHCHDHEEENAAPTPQHAPRPVPLPGPNPGRSAFVQQVLDQQRREREENAMTPHKLVCNNSFITYTKYSTSKEETRIETLRQDGTKDITIEWRDHKGHLVNGKLCASGCGFLVHSEMPHTFHCCRKCEMSANLGHHGPYCEQRVLHHHHFYGPDAAADYLLKEDRKKAMQTVQTCRREAQETTDKLISLLASIPSNVRDRYPESCQIISNNSTLFFTSPKTGNHSGGKGGLFGFGLIGKKAVHKELEPWDKEVCDRLLSIIEEHNTIARERAVFICSLVEQCRRDANSALEKKDAMTHAINVEKQRIFDKLRYGSGSPTRSSQAFSTEAPAAAATAPSAPVAESAEESKDAFVPMAVARPAKFNTQDQPEIPFAVATPAPTDQYPSMRQSFAAPASAPVAQDAAVQYPMSQSFVAPSAPMESEVLA